MVTGSILKPVRCGEPAAESTVFRRSVVIIFTLAPWPFFELGILCAPLHANILFHITWFGYVACMCLGFYAQSLDWQRTMHRIGLFWNIFSSWIVSAWWCSGPISWSVLMVLVLALVTLSAHICSLGGQRWRSAITLVGACVSYSRKHLGWFGHFETALLRRLSAAPGEELAPTGNASMVGEEEEEAMSEGVIGACVAALLVLPMLVCMDVLFRCHRYRRGNQVIAPTSGMSAASAAPLSGGFTGVVPQIIVVEPPQIIVVEPLGERRVDGQAAVLALPIAIS